MPAETETSDVQLLDLLRARDAMAIGELVAAMGVTATAVRQRLARLMRGGLVERKLWRALRGRPGHRYSLTEKGRRQSGTNFADLALALWQEIRKINDPAVRSGLLRRVSASMAEKYAPQVHGTTPTERMASVRDLLADRSVAFDVDTSGQLPVLTAIACPYPQLAEQDSGICAVENMLFSELVGTKLKLSDCRLDGASCCRFEVSHSAGTELNATAEAPTTIAAIAQ